jgi:hypothetical protein
VQECCIKLYKKNPLCAFCRREFGLPIPPINQQLATLATKYKLQQEGGGDGSMETGLNIEQDVRVLLVRISERVHACVR